MSNSTDQQTIEEKVNNDTNSISENILITDFNTYTINDTNNDNQNNNQIDYHDSNVNDIKNEISNLNDYIISNQESNNNLLENITEQEELNNNEQQNNYIKELEDIVKFQEEEINNLKNEIINLKSSQSNIDYLVKIKQNLEKKEVILNDDINNFQNNEKTYSEPSFTEFKLPNQDINLSSNAQISRITKKNIIVTEEESQGRYSGITILEKLKDDEQIKKIQIDYSNIDENSEKIVKQRRRRAKF